MSVHASLAQEKLVHSVERTLSAPSPSEPNGRKPLFRVTSYVGCALVSCLYLAWLSVTVCR